MHKGILYSSYKMRNDKFLSQTMTDKSKDRAAKLLEKHKHLLQPNMICFFSDEKIFLPESEGVFIVLYNQGND